MTTSSLTKWIAQRLVTDPPRSKSLVMTIFGDSIVPHGGIVWLGSLIELLVPFGVNDRLLRTSVFRLAQEGWLGSERDGRRSSYAITPESLPRFARAYRRIYAQPVDDWDGSWTLLMNVTSNIDPVGRPLLRKELLWVGYCYIAPGVAAHPQSDPGILGEILKRTGMENKVYVCRVTDLPGLGGQPLNQLVNSGWDLTLAEDSYRQFIEQFTPLKKILRDDSPLSAEHAFVIRTLLIHAYRRVQLHDPQLPSALQPLSWPRAEAYALTRDLYRTVCAAAEAHLLLTLRKENPCAPEADASFHERLGGLN